MTPQAMVAVLAALIRKLGVVELAGCVRDAPDELLAPIAIHAFGKVATPAKEVPPPTAKQRPAKGKPRDWNADAAAVLRGLNEGLGSREQLRTFTGIPDARLHYVLCRLRDNGAVRVTGKKRGARWVRTKP